MSYQSYEKTWRKLKNVLPRKKPTWKGYILYDSIHMTSEKGKPMETVKELAVARKEERGCE